MARLVNKLTALKVANVITRGLYGDGNGLWLQVSASGSKSWVFRFNFVGNRHHMGLGGCATYRWRRHACSPRISRAGCEMAAIP